MTIDYPNHHATNPYYAPDLDRPGWRFTLAMEWSFTQLNARRAAQYESELVPLSKGSKVLVVQHLFPLNLTNTGKV